jgi:tetratricopeptide (TPR) repeat protein
MTNGSEILKKQGRPRKDSRFEPYFENMRIYGALRALAAIPHASKEENPRLLPRLSLYDHKKRQDDLIGEIGPIPEALHYAFYADKYRSSPEKAVALPCEHLWWLAAPQDSLLLSDRNTDHYTEVAHVDREKERIYFHDYWPKDFFLLQGRNAIGAAARLDNDGLSLSKAEFLKAVVGLMTLDTPALIEHYFAAFPERRQNPDTLLRFGLVLLDAEKDLLVPFASGYILAALQVAELAGDTKIVQLAASKAYLAALCGADWAATAGDMECHRKLSKTTQELLRTWSLENLFSNLNEHDFARLGNVAVHAQAFDVGVSFLTRALELNPRLEAGYWLRASAENGRGNFTAATADAERALTLNDENLATLKAGWAARAPCDRLGKEDDNRHIGGLLGKRKGELAILIQACCRLRRFDRAREAAQALVGLTPDKPVGYLKLAVVERDAGKWEAARAALREAISRETNPQAQVQYQRLEQEMVMRCEGSF